MKKILSIFLIALCLSTSVMADAKGMGYDIIYSVPVADPDAVSDEGALGLDVVSGLGGDRNSLTLNVKYQLRKMSKVSSLSLNFLAFSYDWSNPQASVESKELQLNLYYARSLLKNRVSDVGGSEWRPSKWSLSYYLGIGVSSSTIDVDIIPTVAQAAVTELNGLRSGSNFVGAKDHYAIPLNFGLVGNLSLTPRHGIEVFGNIDQHIKIDDPAFSSSYAPSLTFGGIYHFRANPNRYFPMEYSAGLIANTLSNDIEDGLALNFMLGLRKRF